MPIRLACLCLTKPFMNMNKDLKKDYIVEIETIRKEQRSALTSTVDSEDLINCLSFPE